jgi:hypothetical protein
MKITGADLARSVILTLAGALAVAWLARNVPTVRAWLTTPTQ